MRVRVGAKAQLGGSAATGFGRSPRWVAERDDRDHRDNRDGLGDVRRLGSLGGLGCLVLALDTKC